MKKCLVCCALLLAPVWSQAAGRGAAVSLGYSFLWGHESDFNLTFPVGAYVAVSGNVSSNLGLEANVSFHRHFESDDTNAGNEFDAVAGPRFEFAGAGENVPYIHVLGGVAHVSAGGESDTAVEGLVGVGTDLKAGRSAFVRLGLDYRFLRQNGVSNHGVLLGLGLTFGRK